MSLVDGASVRNTFLDFWSEDLRAAALPHRAIELSNEEAACIRQAHRFGVDDLSIFNSLAERAVTDGSAPVFLRMGYGSWAPEQQMAFGDLRVDHAERAAEVLALPSRRLAEVSRRWVRGFTPKLFVRPFIPTASTGEVRVLIRDGIPVEAWRRHQHAMGLAIPSIPDAILRAVPPAGSFTVDLLPEGSTTRLIDFNPVVGSPKGRCVSKL